MDNPTLRTAELETVGGTQASNRVAVLLKMCGNYVQILKICSNVKNMYIKSWHINNIKQNKF